MSEMSDETPSHLDPVWLLLQQQYKEQIARLKYAFIWLVTSYLVQIRTRVVRRKREDDALAPTKQAKTERTP
jgi:hypothetical protein